MPFDYPSQDYFVSAKVRLTIRFDEFGNTKGIADAPAKSTKNLNGAKVDRGALQPQPDPTAPAGVHRFILLPKGQTAAPLAHDQARSPDGFTFDVTCVPADMTWDQTGIRSADKLSCTIKFIDCPIDPRTVRACAIEAFIGTSKSSDYAAGNRGEKRNAEDESLALLPDDYVDEHGQKRTNSRFRGFVDEWQNIWTADGEPAIELTCRDLTGLMIDQELPSNHHLTGNKPIDEDVAIFLSHYNQMQGISVEYRPNTDTPPIINKVLSNTSHRPNLGPVAAKGGSGGAGGAVGKQSIWDYLSDVCNSIGHAIFLQKNVVIIQRARSLMEHGTTSRRADDPFQGRKLPGSGDQLDFRRFVYGKNIKEMRIRRDFTKNVPQLIEVRAYSAKTVVVVRYPEPKDRANLKFLIPGGAQPDQKWKVIQAPGGITDKETLRVIAQNYYESYGRQELGVEIQTDNLSSFGGGNLDPDILDMRFGDTFEVLTKRDEAEFSTLTKIESLLDLKANNVAFMKALGFPDDFANAYAQAYTDAHFTTLFRLHTMKVTWNVDEGISLTISGVNYVEVRADKSLPSGEEPGTTTNTSSTTTQASNDATNSLLQQ